MCYRVSMEVTITQFRRNLFTLADKAMEGTEVWVKHKGRRFRLEPEQPLPDKLARIKLCDVMNYDVLDDGSLLKEMTEAWEKDWAEI